MTIDTVAARAYPTLPRIDKFIATARKFLACRDPPAQLWQVLLGHMSSLEKLVPRGRLRMRSLQWHLKSHWSPERDPPNLPVPRSRLVEEDLSWWMVRDHLLEGTPFGTPTPDLRLYSDVSRAGWRAHLLDQSVSGVWSHQESSLHINLLELKALFLALRAFSHQPSSHRPLSDSDVRQFDCNRPCEQVRGHGLRLPLLVDRVTSPMDGIQQSPTRSEVLAGTVQRPGGTAQSPEPGPGGGVVTPPAGSKGPTAQVGVPHARPVRNTPQCQAAAVLLPDP